MVRLIVPSLEDVVTKWVEEAPRRAPYYERYAPAAAPRWEANTIAAEATYKSAVTAPDIAKRFSGGVKRVKAAKFERKVREVGVGRFGPGITAAREDYSTGLEPYLAELARIDVPARKPRGDPANLDRVRVIFDALHKKRLAVLAALT